jgi:signal transduction histidine kinase
LAEALSEQEKLRKRLTSDIAHELRTPLTSIGSHLEAMIDGLWEATPERMQSCYDELNRLNTLVVDLGKIKKIESDNLKLNKTTADLLNIAQIVVNNMMAEAERKNISLIVKGNSSFVEIDKDRINQVITNLLSNAIKFTPEGGSIQIEIANNSQNSIIKVKDNGIGIPEHEIPFIFERFYRTENSRNRKSGGAGIGLAIVESIIAAHGGIVTVDAHCNDGSCFIVQIPKTKKYVNIV